MVSAFSPSHLLVLIVGPVVFVAVVTLVVLGVVQLVKRSNGS